MVIAGDRAKAYEGLLGATPKDVRLVLVGGRVLYGDKVLVSLGQSTPSCENLDICGTQKFACVAAAGGTAANKFAQTYSQIRETIETELRKYDDLNLTEWTVQPMAELYRCP